MSRFMVAEMEYEVETISETSSTQRFTIPIAVPVPLAERICRLHDRYVAGRLPQSKYFNALYQLKQRHEVIQ